MKNLKSRLLLAGLSIGVLFSLSSCTTNEQEDTKEVASDHNEAKFNNDGNENDAQFLVNAAEISREEISLGQLAQKTSKTDHVRDLGKMMETAHTKSLADLTALAKSKNITLPEAQTENGQDDYKKLNDKTGNDFDKAYADMMVKEHEDAISVFEKAAAESKDVEIQAWATSSLPALREHLDASMICQAKCEKK